MAKSASKIHNPVSSQQGLFPVDISEGSLDIVLGLKQLLSKTLRGTDRYMIAAQISKATLKDISKDTLDKILSSDPAYQPSAVQVVAICALANSLEPFQYLLEPLGSDVLNPEDRDLIELARLQEQERVIKAKMDAIRTKRGLR
jgi:hypothetical protein